MHSAISFESSSLPCPANTMSFFLETSSTTSPLSATLRCAAGYLRRGRSALAVALFVAVVVRIILALRDPALLDRGRDALRQRAGGHVAGDDRTGSGVGAVAHLDRRDEHGVGTRARVGTDLGAVL